MRTKPILFLASFLSLVALVSMACNLAAAPSQSDQGLDAAFTQAANTIEARLTQQAQGTVLPTETPNIILPATQTLAPSSTLLPTGTQAPTATPPPPTATQVPPTPTATEVPCNWAQYVGELNVPDGTVFAPNAQFTKTWRIRNIGSCTWDDAYDLVYVDGDRLGAAKSIPFEERVRPGETVDLSVEMVAPDRSGRFRSYWMLREPYGDIFGIGDNADSAFWAAIRVTTPPVSKYSYDFAANYCAASWRSSAGAIPCSGSTSDPDGSVALLDSPDLEDGRTEDELALWMRPEETSGGWVEGTFPPYLVREGDHFVAEVGCLEDNQGCNVTFSLDYRIGNKSTHNLGTWNEVYDGDVTRIDVDLSSLAGQNVKLILGVTANSRPSRANAFWFVPSIRAGSKTPGEYIPAVQRAREQLARDLQVELSRVEVKSVEAVNWPDSCLGIRTPDMECKPVQVSGYRVLVLVDGLKYEAHTNENGSLILWLQS